MKLDLNDFFEKIVGKDNLIEENVFTRNALEAFIGNGDKDPKKTPKISPDIEVELNLTHFLELIIRLVEVTSYVEKTVVSETHE